MSAVFPFTGDSLSLIEVIYLGYFGRAGDPGGVNFWGNYLQSGGTLQSTSASFSVQVEARAQYPFLANPLNATPAQIEAFLNQVYENLFGRTADAGGLAFWSGQIQNALNSQDPIVIANEVGFVITQIAFGAQTADRTVLENKITASDFLTQLFAQDGINTFPNPSAQFTFLHTNIASVHASFSSVVAAEQAATAFPALLSSALTGPLVLSKNGILVGDGFGAGNDVTVSGPNGADDAFTMTATSVAGQDWGNLNSLGIENVTLEFTAGVPGSDLDLGGITMHGDGSNTLNFTGNANVSVTDFSFFPLTFGNGAIALVGGGIINDTDTGVLHFGTTTAQEIFGTTGGGIIMAGIDTSPTGATEFGSATGWNNLAGSVRADTFNGGTGNAVPGGEGDIFLTNGGADTVNLAPGHSANHIEIYGGDGTTTTDGGITVYQAMLGSITTPGLAQPGFWGNTNPGGTNDIFSIFTSSGISSTQVTINGFDVASDVVDLALSAWEKVSWHDGLLQLNGNDPPGGFPAPPASSDTGTPAVITGQLFSGGNIAGAPAGADVILFGGNFTNAAALGSSLHINHFGLFTLGPNGGLTGGVTWHEIGVYNDLSNNAHIVDIALKTTEEIDNNFFSDDPNLKIAVSDMAVLVGVNANSLTGANIHFVT